MISTGKTKKFSCNFFIQFLLTFLIVLSLRVRYEIGSGLETGSFLVDNLSKLANQFHFDGLADILVFATVFLLLKFVNSMEKKADILTGLLSVAFAVLFFIANICQHLGNFLFIFANIYQIALSLMLIFAYSVLFYCAVSLVYFLAEKETAPEAALRSPLKIGAFVIFICWLPWLLMNYPCSFCPDATSQLSQWFGLSEWSAHHPPFSSLIMGLCIWLGDLVWDRNFGCFLYILLQSVSGALLFSYMLSVLYRMGISRKVWTAFLLFFAATPFWACFAQWFEKDFLYAQAFTLCIVFLLPVIDKRKCELADAIRIAVVALLAILLRKTGAYELIPALLLIALWLKKNDRVRMLSATLAVILFSFCVNNVVYPALGIASASSKEALSIPFLQTARYVNAFPDEVTEEERAAIDAVLVYDELDKYNPIISDSIKNNYRENPEALPEYFKVWFQMLLKHPVCYFEAAFMLSYGYIAPVAPSLDAYILSEFFPRLSDLGIYRVFGAFPTKAFDSIRQMFIEFPLTSILCTAGLYTWILMLCFVQALRKNHYRSLLLFLPGIMNVLICIASPLYASTRYELPVIACTPIFIGWMLIYSKKSN